MPFFDANDLFLILHWWIVLLLVGLLTLPITASFFNKFFDKGYIFSKIVGVVLLSYTIFFLGTIHLLTFTRVNIFFILSLYIITLTVIFLKRKRALEAFLSLFKRWKIFLFEETLFLCALLFWSYIKSFQPDIIGLEKYMDFGFMNSILRSNYFPAKDMWFTPLSINYYYFGHIIAAVLTKLSAIPSNFSYNLILATIFALCFTGSFSISANLLYEKFKNKLDARILTGGILSAFLVTVSGNFHTIYTFFKPYENENPVPFWQLIFSPQTFPNSYWYPNATRFIYNTIHEFPSYSFVVSDLHGHVFSIPIVLTIIALAFSILTSFQKKKVVLISFLLACAYMTNAWDGIIYFLLSSLVILFSSLSTKTQTKLERRIKYHVLSIKIKKEYIIRNTYYIILIFIFFILFSLPFSFFFKPFVSGMGILCAPQFLTNIGKIGPFLFESNHCQHSPLWQLFILYGFFYFWVISFLIFIYKKLNAKRYTLDASDLFIFILIFLSNILLILPEFIYMKDIYPAHYRANTMFKLAYQAFIMLSLVSGYAIINILPHLKPRLTNPKSYWKIVFFVISVFSVFLVLSYPHFATRSYFGDLKNYSGLDGTKHLKNTSDYDAINFLNKTIVGQPVVLEAQGDSYTNYARVSANTGLPTVLGWTVHEWLWRGTYDIPAPRIEEIKNLYETSDLQTAKKIIDKYRIKLVFLGQLEKDKYPLLSEEKFTMLGKIIFSEGQTKIYKLH